MPPGRHVLILAFTVSKQQILFLSRAFSLFFLSFLGSFQSELHLPPILSLSLSVIHIWVAYCRILGTFFEKVWYCFVVMFMAMKYSIEILNLSSVYRSSNVHISSDI